MSLGKGMGVRAGLQLRRLLKKGELLLVPCAHDALSARLIHQAGFPAVFNSGYCISAVHGFPDTGLLSFAEMLAAHNTICESLPYGYPVFADGDTGYGNAMNVKRTIRAYEKAGVAAIMLEDQVDPKQCGHSLGKQVVSRNESVAKIRAARDARFEWRAERGVCSSLSENDFEDYDDILILARTDARATMGIEEAIERCKLFLEAGADITFLEAPQSVEEMKLYCDQVPGWKMANMLARGKTPALSPNELEEMGYSFAAYPFDIMCTIIESVQTKLEDLKQRDKPPESPSSETVEKLWEISGFNAYQEEQKQYGCAQYKQEKVEAG
mmetsp:Transcript_30704/g.37923  ORF Transcript_30704/g.37923 Transcript_30704/m.37923 type:complete len:326 (+) Transcript_30704:145-1122(+)